MQYFLQVIVHWGFNMKETTKKPNSKVSKALKDTNHSKHLWKVKPHLNEGIAVVQVKKLRQSSGVFFFYRYWKWRWTKIGKSCDGHIWRIISRRKDFWFVFKKEEAFRISQRVARSDKRSRYGNSRTSNWGLTRNIYPFRIRVSLIIASH